MTTASRRRSLRSRTATLATTTAIILLSLWQSPSFAQSVTAESDVSARDLIENAEAAENLLEEKEQSDPDAIDQQSTPLNSILGLRKAMRTQDYEAAGKFLDRRYVDESLEQYSDAQLLKALTYVWGRQNIVDITSLSDVPEGNLNDGLPSYRDQIGSITLSDGEIAIYLQRVPNGKGGKVWKLSNATVEEIPRMWEELGYSPIAIKLSKILPDFSFMGMNNWQVIATVIAFIVAWPLASLISYILMRIALLIPNRFPLGIKSFFRRSARFFIFIMLVRYLIAQLGLSLTARILLESSGMDFIAYTLLLMGLLSLLRDYQIRKMQHAGNTHYVALLKPFTIIVKVIMVTIIALYWAKAAGYDMSTILAGLGVGSLAVALAAQKTLENVIGAITLYTARPVSAGDLCRFGNVVGTVADIGLRSTLIRTLDRTMVVVPNSVFSSVEIENFSERDRIRYYRKFHLLIPKAEKMRAVLADVQALLLANTEVLDDTISVRFETIVEANAVLRIDAGVNTTNYQEFLAVAEDINLHILDIAEERGITFTGAGHTVQLLEQKFPELAPGSDFPRPDSLS